MNNSLLKTKLRGSQQSILTRSFLVAGVIFLAVFLTGIAVWQFLDASGSLREAIDRGEILRAQGGRLSFIFFTGMVLSLVSFVMIMIWNFRFQTASFTFAYITIAIYSLSQGAGFGIMFAVMQLQDIIYAFGLAGGMFTAMALLGYFIKDASGLGPWLLGLMVVEMVASVVFIIMWAVGVFSQIFYLFLTIGSTLVTCLFIVYTIWRIKTMDQWLQAAGGSTDEQLKKRLVLFFGFLIATQFIRLVWLMLRLMQFVKR